MLVALLETNIDIARKETRRVLRHEDKVNADLDDIAILVVLGRNEADLAFFHFVKVIVADEKS